MQATYLFVGGPMDGLQMPFTTPIPAKVKVSKRGTMETYHGEEECDWPFYSLIPVSNDPDRGNCTGKFLYVEQCSILDGALRAFSSSSI